jgi:hypothetical protein
VGKRRRERRRRRGSGGWAAAAAAAAAVHLGELGDQPRREVVDVTPLLLERHELRGDSGEDGHLQLPLLRVGVGFVGRRKRICGRLERGLGRERVHAAGEEDANQQRPHQDCTRGRALRSAADIAGVQTRRVAAAAPPPIPTPQDRRAADERMRRVTREGWRGVEGAAHQRRGRTS